MKRILASIFFGLILFSLFSPLVLSSKDNILFYGKDLGKIENSINVNYSINKVQTLPLNISQYKVITIISPEKGFLPEDITRLLDYVNSGGTLFLIAEDFTEGSTTSQYNRLLYPLNLEFNVDRLYDDSSFYLSSNNVLIKADDNFFPSKGVSKILYVNGCTLKGSFDGYQNSNITSFSKNYDGFETYKKGQRPVVSAFKRYGKGIILLVGDRSFLEDTYVTQQDNALFALNLFDFAAGNYDLISQRVDFKQRYDKESLLFYNSFLGLEKQGFSTLKPNENAQINSLIAQAKNNYSLGLYQEAYDNMSKANLIFNTQINLINNEFNLKLQKAKNLEIQAINKGVPVADEAVFNEGVFYLRQAEKETNLEKRISMIDSALQILENFGQGDKQRAKIEIDTAESKLKEAKQTLFYENDVLNSEEYLNQAKEFYNKGNYSEAISRATESEKYANRAIEKFTIFKIIIGLGLLLGALLLMIITKRIFAWKKQKEK